MRPPARRGLKGLRPGGILDLKTLNSELLTFRKILCNTNVWGHAKNTRFRSNRSEFNILFFTVRKAMSTGDDISFLQILLHLEFTLNFSTIFVRSFNIRASQEGYPTEVRSPEIGMKIDD